MTKKGNSQAAEQAVTTEQAATTDIATIDPAGPLALANQFAADGNDDGFEGTGQADFAIPFLTILQALSPQCSQGDPQYDENLRPGMFYNSVTKEAYSGKTGILFVPSMYRRVGNLWTPRSEGGGFCGTMDVAQLEGLLANCTQDENYNDTTPDGKWLVDTREWFGMLVTDSGVTPVLLPLKKTQLKKSKRWLTLAQGIRVNGKPVKLWSQVYRLTTVPEKSDKGSWMGLEISHVGNVPSIEMFREAEHFREMIRSGAAKVVQEGEDHPAGDAPFTDQF